MPASHLRITSVPPGEAPLWVREKWVGLSLPLAQRKAQARSLFTSEASSPASVLFWQASSSAGQASSWKRRPPSQSSRRAVPKLRHGGKRTHPTCCGKRATSCSRKMLVMSARLDLGPERARYLRARPLHSVVFLLLLATVAAAEAPATRQSGFTRLTVANPMGGGAIQTVVWYPTTAPASLIKLGPFDLDVAIDSEPEAGAHPLIVVSHGTGGSNLGHHDTAIYLARHGFVVATPMHPGDNFQDTSAYGTDAQLFGRPRHVKAVLDAVVAHPVFGRVVDTARIGIVGMSAGGYTALVLAGGPTSPSSGRIVANSRLTPGSAGEDARARRRPA